MNKILREEMEYLINCNDKAITPDVKDDVFLTLQYIDELENKINKAIDYNQKIYDTSIENERLMAKINLDILRGEDDD